MADIRTLKLALLADTKDFIDKLDGADKEARSFGDKLGSALKKGALAFAALGAAAGVAAIKIGVDAVKAAIQDSKEQATLAQTLRNTTKATDTQIRSVEDYITKTERASAVNATELRPSLDRLVRSTGDVTKAQKLQQLALDIAAGTGKDLATVTEALGKAYDGNLGALKRIGVPLDAAIIKSKDFDAAQKELAKTFAGQADVAANTFEGRMTRLKLAIDEATDEIGFALLPILEKLLGFITETALPLLNRFVEGFKNVSKTVNFDLGGALEYLKSIFAPILNGITTAFNTIRDALVRNEEKLKPLFDLFKLLGAFIKDVLIPILAKGLGDAFIVIGNIISGVIDFIANLVSAIDSGIKKIQGFIDKIQEAIDKANRLPVIGSLIPDSITSTGAKKTSGSPTINVNIQGAIDPQSTARQVTKVLNTAQRTTGLRAFAN